MHLSPREYQAAKQSLREVEHQLHASHWVNLAARFFKYCPRFSLNNNDCWEWKGTYSSSGYGHLSQGNYRTKAKTNRVAYMLFRGPIPLNPGQTTKVLMVCHVCDNKRCVRPSHLFLGSSKDNYLDYVEKFGPHPGLSAGFGGWKLGPPMYLWKAELCRRSKKAAQLLRGRYKIFTVELAACGFTNREIAYHVPWTQKRLERVLPGHIIRPRPWALYTTPPDTSIDERLQVLRMGIGSLAYKLWKVRTYTRGGLLRHPNGSTCYPTYVSRTHKALIDQLVDLLAMLNHCSIKFVWRWIFPGRYRALHFFSVIFSI